MASGGGSRAGDVRGFLHVCCIGSYRDVTREIVDTILESGLYRRSTVIDVGVLGSPVDQQVVEEMLAPFDRFRIAFRSEDVEQYEYPTLGLLQDACRTWDRPVYYLHTKGVSYSPANQYARYWRRLMLDQVVTNHERCLAELENTDTVGVNWAGDHYSGNFWWARPSHIRRLPDIRGLRLNPRTISLDERVDGRSAPGRGIGTVWNTRLQCEHWLHMVPGRVGIVGPGRRLHLYRELCWSVSARDIAAELLAASGGQRITEIAGARPEPATDADVIVVDLRDDPARLLDLVERQLPTLRPGGAILVRHTNPPSAWHQRPAAEFTPGSEWTGQAWRAVVAFRNRHPSCQVFTVDTDWGVTVIRPGRRARNRPGPDVGDVDSLGWAEFVAHRTQLLNLVDVAGFRRSLHDEDPPEHSGGPAPSSPAGLATQPYAGNRDLLLAAVRLDPDDLRSVLHLGDSYFTAGDFAASRSWYSRALELRDWWWSGFDEAIYIAMMGIAEAMTKLGEPWPAVRDAYLQAWEFCPDRVAPLYLIARHYRSDQRYQLGYLYAKAGADIALPGGDDSTARVPAYRWRVLDELAVCASWTGRTAEAFATWRELLARPELPDADRTRIAGNRDSCVPAMMEAAASYPAAVPGSRHSCAGDPAITVSVIAGPVRRIAEHTLNSFLNCCLDLDRVGRFLAVDAGLTTADREFLRQRYGFLEFAPPGPATLEAVRPMIETPLWFHLGSNCRFFAPDRLLTRLESVLAAEPQVAGASPDSTPSAAGPVMYRTARLNRPEQSLASLDESLCSTAQLITVIGRGNSGTRAIAKTLMRSGVHMGEPIKEDSADLVPAQDMYEACRIIARYIPWRGGLEWDFGPVQTMPIPSEFTTLVERYLDSVLSHPGARTGWKLPETTLCYPWIRRLFPDIHYIFWVRDPRDCIAGQHFTDDLRDFGIDYPRTDDLYVRRAISWKYQDDLVAATPPPRHRITVRLEDFVRHQERELARLEDYLGCDLARVPVSTDPIGRHRQVPGLPVPEFLEPALRRYRYLGPQP